MSRSYKKHNFCTDGKDGRKIQKRWANRKVRNEDEIPNGKAYKKRFCSYDIHDYISRWTWSEAKAEWEKEDSFWKIDYPTLKDFYRFWRKCYLNK